MWIRVNLLIVAVIVSLGWVLSYGRQIFLSNFISKSSIQLLTSIAYLLNRGLVRLQ
jgi:hypothetical protein